MNFIPEWVGEIGEAIIRVLVFFVAILALVKALKWMWYL